MPRLTDRRVSLLDDMLWRRRFLHGSAVGLAGLALPDILRARAASAASGSAASPGTAVIYVELAGGPSQFETYDPKPDAPLEYRGGCGVVRTGIAGVRFSELMAGQARVTDRLAIVRSVRHSRNNHDPSSHLVQTGYYKEGRKGGPNEFPCIGSVTAKLRGPNRDGLPGYVAVPKIMRNGAAAFLGSGYNPFEVGGDPNRADFAVRNLALASGLTAGRLGERRSLLERLDVCRRVIDDDVITGAIDRFTREALELVTGPRARRAFDIESEDPRLRDLYGRSTGGQGMLLARRLVEAGVTFVTVRVTGWDDHNQIEKRIRQRGPEYDRGMAALLTDLHQRGLDRDVLVVAMGEFGRTPRINKNAGRDHWGAVMSVLLAGGDLKMGQIIGSSNRRGEVPVEAPYQPENVLAMVYRHLGIDPAATLPDFSGRPLYLLERRGLIEELI